MTEYLLYALLAGAAVAAAAGPFGSVMIWRGMAYFGETLAHSTLLGVTLALALGIRPLAGMLAVMLGMALLLHVLQRQRRLRSDTILAMLSHGALALGLVLGALFPRVQANLESVLFGDILAVGPDEAMWLAASVTASLIVLLRFWQPLVLATVAPDIAQVEGARVEALRLLYTLLLTVVVAVAARVVGMLLLIALMVVPAASARLITHTPGGMALLAGVLGVAAVTVGMAASWQWDTPTGPSIVLAAVAGFFAVAFAARLRLIFRGISRKSIGV